MGNKDSIANTFFIAIGVCLVCSLLVSGAHYVLKDMQTRNRELDIKANIISVTGMSDDDIENNGGIEEVFKNRIDQLIVSLETGEDAIGEVQELLKEKYDSTDAVVANYDQFVEAKNTNTEGVSVALGKKSGIDDIASIKRRENYGRIYIFKDADGNPQKYIFPVRGLGLWSTLRGFIALESDFQTISGLSYYSHGETPGLGGEVDNPKWKGLWSGKRVFDENGDIAIKVVKGVGDDEYSVDGLSGATITSNGVTYMLEFWLGENGYGPFIEKHKSTQSNENSSEGATDG